MKKTFKAAAAAIAAITIFTCMPSLTACAMPRGAVRNSAETVVIDDGAKKGDDQTQPAGPAVDDNSNKGGDDQTQPAGPAVDDNSNKGGDEAQEPTMPTWHIVDYNFDDDDAEETETSDTASATTDADQDEAEKVQPTAPTAPKAPAAETTATPAASKPAPATKAPAVTPSAKKVPAATTKPQAPKTTEKPDSDGIEYTQDLGKPDTRLTSEQYLPDFQSVQSSTRMTGADWGFLAILGGMIAAFLFILFGAKKNDYEVKLVEQQEDGSLKETVADAKDAEEASKAAAKEILKAAEEDDGSVKAIMVAILAKNASGRKNRFSEDQKADKHKVYQINLLSGTETVVSATDAELDELHKQGLALGFTSEANAAKAAA